MGPDIEVFRQALFVPLAASTTPYARFRFLASILFASCLAFGGCAYTPASTYHHATLLDRIVVANKQTRRFFSSVSAGTTSHTFMERRVRYKKIIRRLKWLRIQVRSRPVPPRRVALVEHVNRILRRRGIAPLGQGDYPSARALASAVESIEEMRDIDGHQGLTATEVREYTDETAIYMRQALTYESAYATWDQSNALLSRAE